MVQPPSIGIYHPVADVDELSLEVRQVQVESLEPY
jgi:hypothetical protein